MPNFEHPASPELSLSPEAIENIREELSASLTLRGVEKEMTDVYPAYGQAAPLSYSYKLNQDTLVATGLIGRDEQIEPADCEAMYVTACLLDPDDPTSEWQPSLTVAVKTRLRTASDKQICRLEKWYIGAAKGRMLRGERFVEFSAGEKRISPGMIPHDLFGDDVPTNVNDPRVARLLDDLEESFHPLLIDDNDKLLNLARYIRQESAPLDEV